MARRRRTDLTGHPLSWDPTPNPELDRRALLRSGFLGLGLFASGNWLTGCSNTYGTTSGSSVPDPPMQSAIPSLGPLQMAPDSNGLRLPSGFTSRVVARTGEKPVDSLSHLWHSAPDGGATFPTTDGGWTYVSNSEASSSQGGVGALRFSASGEVIDAYPILQGTNRNCAGGPTPWETWLSCEEVSRGKVYECDPHGVEAAVALPRMGLFNHEAVAVDPETHDLYQTEDRSDGGFYRFIPADPQLNGRPDLSSGRLEIAVVENLAAVESGGSSSVSWERLSDPSATFVSTRKQVTGSTQFKGGEGIWYRDGYVYFSTKRDHRIWAYEIAAGALSLIYDRNTFGQGAILSEPDNVTVSAGGDVLVAEDRGDMQIVAITPDGELVALVQFVGHDASEVTGPAFDLSETRLYFSSQRGAGASGLGITYEVSGPFLIPAPADA